MTREWGRITFIAKDEDDTWTIRHDSDGGSQAFVLRLAAAGTATCLAFRAELSALFGVRFLHDAKGRECFALRCFDLMHEPIEGFEVDGKRWLRTDFLKRFFRTMPNRLEQRKQSSRLEIMHFTRRIEEEKQLLSELDGMFHDWSKLP